MFSGDTPLPVTFEERKQVRNAALYLQVPRWVSETYDKQIKYYVIAFDGTGNDKDNIYGNSRQTVVAHLFNLLTKAHGYNGQYYKGPGTQKNFFPRKLDSAQCYSCKSIAKKALRDFEKYLKRSIDHSSNTEVRVITIGFSRGAAIARHFMNNVGNKFQTSLYSDKNIQEAPLVRTIGILYDTVATSVEDELQLEIAPSTDFLLHFIAKDESRRLFPVIRDFDIDFPPMSGSLQMLDVNHCASPEIYTSERMIHIALPGAHSDIGASYKSGLGNYYRVYGEVALSKLGLIDKPYFVIEDDTFTAGKHDSRGMFDIISDFIFGKEKRGAKQKISKELSKKEFDLLKVRLQKMHLDMNGFNYQIDSKGTGSIVFDVRKQGNSLQFLGTYNFINKVRFKYDAKSKQRSIIYSFPKSSMDSIITISNKVWNSIPENQNTRLELVELHSHKAHAIYLFVNCQFMEVYIN
ncbi:phospholipase effector Tle1 domain-containing protein [Pseudoalteromonas sp. C12FD-1]|uniref:phospholipase effector Tle1 domain-containing protein n=1 Tax=Pseudoalteromonas sp. C12FD-1 TaxID=3131979 RepID=UPI00307DC1FF